MSNTGQPNFSGAKAFNASSSSRSFGQLPALGFLAFGAGSMGMAVATALTSPSTAVLGQAAEIMNKVGLDKGPLLMFGALSTAMGFALSRIEKGNRGGDSASDAAAFAQSNASSIELQGEILGSVQAELGGIRGEIAAARQEAAEAQQKGADGNGEASDPLFRLAASLDQLGAQIDKRIDKARREMIDAISGVASSAEVSATQREEAFKVCATDIDSVRMDIADLRAQLTRVAGDVSNTKGVVDELASRPTGATNSSSAEPVTEAVAETAPETAPETGPEATVIEPEAPQLEVTETESAEQPSAETAPTVDATPPAIAPVTLPT